MSNTNPRTELATIHDGPGLTTLAVDDGTAKAMATQIGARWPKDCNPAQALEVARIAIAYGLDPFLKELVPFQGNPYITIAGMVRIAERHPMFDGYTDDIVYGDRLVALRQYPDEIVWECTVYRKDRKIPIRAFGRANGPYDEKQYVAKQRPHDMAQKRAIHRALRASFPVPIPGLEMSLTPEQLRAIHALDDDYGVTREERHEVLSGAFGVESSRELTKDQASAYIDGRQVQLHESVDDDTGEIIDVSPTEHYFDNDGHLIAPRVTGDPSDDVPAMLRLLDAANTPKRYAQAKDYITQIGLHADPEIAGVLDERDRRIAARRSQG